MNTPIAFVTAPHIPTLFDNPHRHRLGPLPSTWTARTPAGWTQYFFAHADPDVFALLTLRPLGPGVEVLHRGFVLAPPSLVGGMHGWWHREGS